MRSDIMNSILIKTSRLFLLVVIDLKVIALDWYECLRRYVALSGV